jgi:hypothetical protein
VTTWWSRSSIWRALLLVAVVSGAALRIHFALTDLGMYWPDEVHQSLEPAHRLAFGHSLIAWEFVAGARNMLFPWFIAGVMKLLALVRLDSPFVYLPVLRVGFALCSMLTVLGTFRLASALGCSLPSSVTAAVALCWMNFFIYLAPRAMPEVVATAPLVWGLAWVFEAPSRRSMVIAGSLLGLAVILRMHCGLFAAGAVVLLVTQRRTREARTLFATLAVWALLYGLIDLVAWGSFFHSARTYLQFNVIEGRAAEFGRAPPAYYTKHLTKTLGALWVLLAVLSVVAARRATALFVMTGLFFLGHFVLPHKELRFLAPILPLLCVLAAAGLESLVTVRWWAGLGAAGSMLVASLFSVVTFSSLTFDRIGRHETTSALDEYGPENRLLMAASRSPDVCGVLLLTAPRWKTYAYAALHRDVPLYETPGPDRALRYFNAVIVRRGTEPGVSLASDGDVELIRISSEPCVRDPAFEPWLDEMTATMARERDEHAR